MVHDGTLLIYQKPHHHKLADVVIDPVLGHGEREDDGNDDVASRSLGESMTPLEEQDLAAEVRR